jgi:rhodanese-related sulfurtransferase
MKKNIKKIDDKTMLSVGLVLILLVVAISILRSMNLSLPWGHKNTVSNSSAAPALTVRNIGYDTIATSDLQKQILSNQKLILLDIRPFQSYATEHIVDSVNVSIDEFPLDPKYDRSYEVVVIGESVDDTDIATAVQKLKDENFTNIKVLAGGIQQWKNLTGSTVSYGNPTSTADQAKVNYITTDQLKQAVDQNATMSVVDLRDAGVYAKSHIKNSLNIPFNDLEKRRFDIPTNKARIIMVGINELQEFEAAVQAHDMLFTKTYVMKGAMAEWTKKNYPLVSN